MKWTTTDLQPNGRFNAKIEALGWHCMVILCDSDNRWYGDLPIGEPRIALQAKDGEAAKVEAETLLRERLRLALAEVGDDPTTGPSELIDDLFAFVTEGSVVPIDDEPTRLAAVYGLQRLARRSNVRLDPNVVPTHVVVDADGEVIGAGLSHESAKLNAIRREYLDTQQALDLLNAKVDRLQRAAKDLFGL